ncbi:MAG: MFS transporter [Myxococcota bacterium]
MLERLRQLPRPLHYLFAGTVATRLGTFVVPYLTIYLSQGRGMSFAATGRVIAAGGIGLLLGNVVGGHLADRVGRRPTLLAAIAINIVGLALLAMELPSDAAYALALAIALAGSGMYTPAANALIADLTPLATRPFAYTVNYVCINVGMGLGPLLGGLIATASYLWIFIGDIALSAACAGFIALGVPALGSLRAASAEDTTSVVRVWASHPLTTGFCLASLFVVAPLMGLEYAVPILVGTTFDRALVFVGVVYSINAACILALSFPIERLIRGRNEAAMMVMAALLWGSGLTILAVGQSIAALLLCTVVWTLGEIVASIVIPTFVSTRVSAAAKGRMLALQDAVRSASAIACPLVLGVVWDEVGVDAVLAILVALPLFGATIYGLWWWRTPRGPG